MLVNLHGRHLRSLGVPSERPFIGRLCERPDLPPAARGREILLVREPSGPLPEGFRGYLIHQHTSPDQRDVWRSPLGGRQDAYLLAAQMHYLAHGDIVRLDPARSAIHVLYRVASRSNSFLVTERCDSHCVMCSQPPRELDDSWIIDELRQVIPLLPHDAPEIGITGGEPALLGPQLVELVSMLGRFVPRTAVHILSNGRRFRDGQLARRLGKLRHPDLMVGIPLYSDLPEEHDYVVQVRGAFSETVRGIIQLKRAGVRVEVRFVIQAATVERMGEFSSFLARNLLFVDHVAFMGLELVGYAKANLTEVWIDPLDYQAQLVAAVATLERAGMSVSVYNHQLCVLDERLHSFARKSISDWKNAYLKECAGCARRSECGGFFASAAVRRSRGIRPFISPLT